MDETPLYPQEIWKKIPNKDRSDVAPSSQSEFLSELHREQNPHPLVLHIPEKTVVRYRLSRKLDSTVFLENHEKERSEPFESKDIVSEFHIPQNERAENPLHHQKSTTSPFQENASSLQKSSHVPVSLSQKLTAQSSFSSPLSLSCQEVKCVYGKISKKEDIPATPSERKETVTASPEAVSLPEEVSPPLRSIPHQAIPYVLQKEKEDIPATPSERKETVIASPEAVSLPEEVSPPLRSIPHQAIPYALRKENARLTSSVTNISSSSLQSVPEGRVTPSIILLAREKVSALGTRTANSASIPSHQASKASPFFHGAPQQISTTEKIVSVVETKISTSSPLSDSEKRKAVLKKSDSTSLLLEAPVLTNDKKVSESISLSSQKKIHSTSSQKSVEVSPHQISIVASRLRSPIVSDHKKKKSRSTSSAGFLRELVRFSVTSAVIFLLSFGAMNYPALQQLISARLDPRSMVEKQIALQNVVQKNILPVPTLPVAGFQRENRKSFPPLNIAVGPLENRIVIPKIGKNIPIVEVGPESLIDGDWKQLEKDIQEGLRDGVVHYPGTANPGQLGNVFITGHSSYYPWDSGKFKDVFALLHDLDAGDEFTIFWNQDVYHYRIYERKVVTPQETEVLHQPSDKRIATLMTCTPVGTAKNRLVLVAEEI
ncbi:sortase [Candidatus Peregrinibacteria bacterium]|nr:MAG: sortase [Candidatus Peregrinibacteria bacterium]